MKVLALLCLAGKLFFKSSSLLQFKLKCVPRSVMDVLSVPTLKPCLYIDDGNVKEMLLLDHFLTECN